MKGFSIILNMNKNPMIAVGLMLLLSAPAYAANECLAPDEKAAFNARVLQTELMEAALSCEEHKSRYNAFVKKYKKQLAEQSAAFRNYFKKKYGSLADSKLNHFVTKLANDVSGLNITKQNRGFCRYTGSKFDKLERVSPEDFAKFSSGENSEVIYEAPCK